MSEWTEDLMNLIFNSSFMTLATADGAGLPWASPVEFVCDEALRFYWVSVIDARHSRNVRSNPRAALSIYDSTQSPGAGAVQGLYGEGPVEELDRPQLEALLPSLNRWLGHRDAGRKTPRVLRADQVGIDTPWRVYRLNAAKLYALDPSGHPAYGEQVDWRVRVHLTGRFSRAYHSRFTNS